MAKLIAPATGKVIGEQKRDTLRELDKRIKSAKSVQAQWAGMSHRKRTAAILKMREFMVANTDRISSVIAECTGKTENDAIITETLPAIAGASYYAKALGKALKPKKLKGSSLLFFNKVSYMHSEPWGVVGIISPWNYPFGIPFHELCAALAAGNCVIMKVATQVQPVGELFVEMAEYAALPDGVFSLLNIPGSKAGDAFIHSGIDKLFFTGSVSVGKALMAEAATELLPLSLELGGNDAMIVCEDANLYRAAYGAVWGGLSNSGQSCGGVERIYVHQNVYDDFMAYLEEAVTHLRQGVGLESDIGALTTTRQKQTVQAHIKDALEKGATIRCQSPAIKGKNYHPAVVLENVTHEMDVMKHETFGPVLGVVKVTSDDEAIALANDAYLGLTASVWTKSRKRADEIAKRLQAGAITVNDHLMSHGMAETPWGGYKMSSYGRSHGGPGIHEMVQSKVVVHDLTKGFKRNMWWHSYSAGVYTGMKAAILGFFSNKIHERIINLGKLGAFYIKRTFG